ncbi:MAG: Asp-tRNA(Asn)/Glu-tRNA(Gln) amidotransferase subunit GatB [Clostridia bacterium]
MILDNGAEVIIGFEVHVELKTASKLFCSCPTTFGEMPNTAVCPVCLGHPGVLPVLNQEAVHLATRAALALGCRINPISRFDRKNYFYADLPKGYQISQFDHPLAEWGVLELPGGHGRTVRIRRIHIEEEAGKLNHEGENLWTSGSSLVDFNRAGIPLIEIVSEPDMRSPDDGRQYLQTLIRLLSYVQVSDLRMEEGSLRCDANISLRPAGYDGDLEDLPRVELKNLNSVRNVVRGLEYEIRRQAALLDAGERVTRETRGFDDASGTTLSQRSKEAANDYRYFPEPDLPALVLEPSWIETVRQELPLLPDQWIDKLVAYGVRAQDAEVLVSEPTLVKFADAVRAAGAEAQAAVTWILGDVARLQNLHHLPYGEGPLTPARLARLLALVGAGTLSGRMAKEVLEAVYDTGQDPDVIVEQRALRQVSDVDALSGIVATVLDANPKVVDDFRAGKDKALSFLVGQVMKATRGQAAPAAVNRLLLERLGTEAPS